MKIPVITGIIDRRILVNFAIDPQVAGTIIPKPFTPKIVNGNAIGGICLIRLKNIRPKGFPAFMGIGSENGAHRFAVEWKENGKLKEGVYIPRRDSSSRFNVAVGGRFFPGLHHHAHFEVKESANNYQVAFKSDDGTFISVNGEVTDQLNADSVFENLSVASDFFKAGALGYSPNDTTYDGLLLNTFSWDVRPLKVSAVSSSFFEDRSIFPERSAKFDNALVMTNIAHEWLSAANICCD